MAPAHQKIYSNLDKAVGHFRRYEKDFFKKNILNLNREKLFFFRLNGLFVILFEKDFF